MNAPMTCLAPPSHALRERVQRIVAESLSESDAPGIVASVLAPQIDPEPIAVSVGWADREAERPMSSDTLFMVGSITKLLTATLVMQLVDEGQLSLDQPVNEHLPHERWVRDRQGRPVDVTLRQLLTHTSGLPPSWDGVASEADPPGRIDDLLEGGLVVHAGPGERVAYANTGFVLLGAVLAERAQQPFAEYARARLLSPLGMTRSTFASPWDTPELAAPYGDMLGGRGRSEHVDVSAIAPASGLITSARELSCLMRMFLDEGQFEGRTIVSRGSVRAMTALQRAAHPGLEEGFGFGFGVRRRGGRREVWWDGALPGSAARLAILPDHEVGVVVLANQTDNAVSAGLVGRLLEALVPAETSRYEPSAEELRSWSGRYQMLDFVDPKRWYLSPLATVQVAPADGTLTVSSWATGETALVPEGPGRFRFRGSAADGAAVCFDGDAMQAGFVRAARMPWWRRALARLAGALMALAVCALRFVRRAGAWRAGLETRRANRPSGPSWREALGLLPLAARDPLRFTEVLTERHGGVVKIPAPGRPFVLVTEPAEVERILVRDRARFGKNREFIDLTSLLLGRSLLTTEGDEWVHHRRSLRALFGAEMARRFAQTAIDATGEILAGWRARPGAIDLGRETNRLALRTVGGWMGGADLRGRADDIKRALDIGQAFFLRRLGLATLLARSPSLSAPRRVRAAIARVRGIAADVVDARRRDPSQDDALSFLLRASGEGELSDEELLDHTITLLVAGHETSGIALAWMIDRLAREPEVARLLREEADAVLGDRPLEARDLPRLIYATQLAYEVIRLYPSLPLIGRDVLESTSLGGVRVPAGATVIISSWAMQRRPELWPEPTRLDPTRFRDGMPSGERRFRYVPFGAGPRVCVGARMTVQQLAIAATQVARGFDLSARGPTPDARVRATLAPSRRFQISVRPRSSDR